MSKEGEIKVATGGAPGKGEKKRWLVIGDGKLTVYKDKKKGSETDSIALSGASVKSVAGKKKKHLELTSGGTTHYLMVDEKEHDAWLQALQGATESGNKLSEKDFDLMNLVGKGSFGKVVQVKKKDSGEIYAMKVLSKKHIIENGEVEHTKSERSILERIKHPFLMNLCYSFQSEDKLYLILDFVNGGELFHHLQKEKRFKEDRVQLYAAEILLAVQHLHENGVIYRDLKPENLLLTDTGHIKLTDFGLCKENMRDTDRTGTFCGTPEYLAPEVLKGQGYTKAVDWWSYGSLVYEMLAGLPPFYSQDVQEMYRKIMQEKLKFPDIVSAEAKEFLTDLLERDMTKRLIDPEKMKKYKFFDGLDWDKVYKLEVTPPFIPEVGSKNDVGQVDPEFLREKPSLDLDDDGQATDIKGGEFDGFTFDAGSSLASAART